MTQTADNNEQIKCLISAMFKPGQVFELRALDATLQGDKLPYDKPRVISGYFDNANDAIASVNRIASAAGIYITVNPVHPALLARANNSLKSKKVTATTDEQIIARQWILLDCDPERAGHVSGIPTNDDEHQTALTLVQELRDALTQEGWPLPIEMDSGNGAYLLIPVDLPANDDGLVQRVLAGLAQRFDTEQVHIDLTTFNQSRIMRLCGTMNCKGDGTADRPHRLSRLLAIPDEIQPVSRDLLESVATPIEQPQAKREQASKERPAQAQNRKRKSKFSLDDFISQHNIEVLKSEAYKGGTKHLLATCPFCGNSDHNAIVTISKGGALGFSCSHNSCKGIYKWEDFRVHFEPDAYDKKKHKRAKRVDPVTGEIDLLAEGDDDEEEIEASQKSILRQLALDNVEELFTTPNGESYARIRRKEHLETLVINERKGTFKSWLIFLYGQEYDIIPNATAISSAIASLEAEAQFGEHPQFDVHLRIAHQDGKVYLDLANDACEVVEVDENGWRVIKKSPVCFKHPVGMLPLPRPVKGGSMRELRQFVNVVEDRDALMMEAWLIGCFHPTGPYPVLNVHGEKGASKSSCTKLLHNLIDPSIAPMRKEPEDGRTLAVLAHNNRVIAFDNLSYMPGWLSDALCRLATGAGDSYRKNYSDDEEVVFNAKRPIVLNGIEEVATRGDLLDRSITINLPAIDKQHRKAEKDYWKEVESAHPRLLGAILDCVSVCIKNLPHTTLPELPRMADFALWIVACEHMLTNMPGAFLEAYEANRENAVNVELDASPVAHALLSFMAERETWQGNATDLLDKLKPHTTESIEKTKEWPKVARALSGKLKRLAPSLRTIGISINTRPGRERVITIIKFDPAPDDAKSGKNDDANDDAKSEMMTQNQNDDAKFGNDDAKNNVCVITSEGLPPTFDPMMTQNDAKKGDNLNGNIKREKKEERNEEYIVPVDDRGGGVEMSSEFASFASQRHEFDRMEQARNALRAGQWVDMPEGTGQIHNIDSHCVTVSRFDKLYYIRGANILLITPREQANA